MTRPAAPPSDVTVTLRCDNRCVFCPRNTLRHVSVRDAEDLDARLRAIRAHSSRVILTGGEVALLPDAGELIARCRSLGFGEVALITNGRAFADAERARELVDAGLTEVSVSLYDPRAEVHDGLTRAPGSHTETRAGLEQLLTLSRMRPDLSIRVNTLLCEANADGLVALLRDLAPRGVRGVLVADVVLSDEYDVPVPHERIAALARTAAVDPAIRGLDVTWRGFPLCVLDGIPGVTAEPQDVDTTVVERGGLDAYFDEFFRHFVHVAACEGCGARARCPGLQRRYRDRLGDGHLRPIPAAPRAHPGTDLDGFGPERDPGRLAVTPTTACQLRCRYCHVALGREVASPEVLDRAADLLLRSSRDELELQFFGGEPLLCRDEVQRTIRRTERLAREGGKRVRFTITTNGLLLDETFLTFLADYDARVLLSLDGPVEVLRRDRPLARGSADAPFETIEANLEALLRSGVPYFVNVVVPPDAVAELSARVAYLAARGVQTVQLCYAMGPGWDEVARDTFCLGLRAAAALAEELAARGRPLRIQNLGSRAEPTILSNDLLVDVDGTVFGDAALFCEAALPGLRDPYRIGHVDELEGLDGLRRSRAENLAILRRTYPEGSPVRSTIDEQLALGRQVQATLDALGPQPSRRSPLRDHNPLAAVLRGGLREQVRLMRRRPGVLPLPLLHLHNPCAYDCVFCQSKPMAPTPVGEVEDWLADNVEEGQTRLGLVGNEPLLHPDLDRILTRAAEVGFRRFEALTTAAPLADGDRVAALVDAGLAAVALPLYAADAALHDRLTGVDGSHAQALRAIGHLRRHDIAVHVHANLMRPNLEAMAALERLVEDDLGLPLCLIPVRPKTAHRPYHELAPRYDEIVSAAPVHTLVGFPLCVAARVQDPAVPDAAIIADVLKVYVLDQPYLKPPVCDECAMRSRCAGTFQAYLDRHGDGELRPFRNAI